MEAQEVTKCTGKINKAFIQMLTLHFLPFSLVNFPGNVDNLVVSSDLSDEIPRVRQIRRNRHPHTQRAHVLVVPNQILHLSHHIERISMFIEKIRSCGSVRRE